MVQKQNKIKYYFNVVISNERKLEQVAYNHSEDVDFKDFKKIWRYSTKELYSFLVVETILLLMNMSILLAQIFIPSDQYLLAQQKSLKYLKKDKQLTSNQGGKRMEGLKHLSSHHRNEEKLKIIRVIFSSNAFSILANWELLSTSQAKLEEKF